MMQSVCAGVLAPLVVVGAVGKLPQRPPAFSGQDNSVTVHLTDRDDMALDAYLQRVLLGEMPASFEPEALKAQAVAARTYTVKHREKHNGKLCTDSTCCQAFCDDGVFAAFSEEDRERAAAALRETDGLVLTYEGALIDATFFSCSGGRTEDALAVWGTDVPYLCSVASPGEEAAQYDRDSVSFSREALEAALDISLGEDKGSWVGAATFTEGDGVETMEMGGQRFTGVYLRKALGQLWPQAEATMDCTLGSSVFVSVRGAADFSAERLKGQIQKIVAQDIPLKRRKVSRQEAISCYAAQGQPNKARLLSWQKGEYCSAYGYGDYMDDFLGEMAPSTGYLAVWDVLCADGGFLFVLPDDLNPDRLAKLSPMPQFFSVFSEGERWCRLMECQNVADLNGLTASGRIRELIRVNEALHEKRFAQVADLVCSRGAQVVLLAGPSSSGKTTSANRLAVQLRVYGKQPVLMSLDDYYIDRDKIAPGPDGKLDLEHINTLDCELFRKDIAALIGGQTVELPTFNFKTGRREWKGKKLGLEKDSVIIAEGLHALNPVMLPENVDMARIFRLYVSPLLPLNLDDHNRIPTSYLRLLRRIVRDYETRGSSVQHTLSMWESVQQGEKRWIFPFQENADMIFNSSTLYELAVLKKHIYPLLAAVQPEESCYDEVQYIVKILDYIQEANVDDEIPPTSLIREFIGGNTFYR